MTELKIEIDCTEHYCDKCEFVNKCGYPKCGIYHKELSMSMGNYKRLPECINGCVEVKNG